TAIERTVENTGHRLRQRNKFSTTLFVHAPIGMQYPHDYAIASSLLTECHIHFYLLKLGFSVNKIATSRSNQHVNSNVQQLPATLYLRIRRRCSSVFQVLAQFYPSCSSLLRLQC